MISKHSYIYIYYFVLLVILLLRTSTASPSIILRVAYLVSFLTPLLFSKKQYYPPILLCFMTIGTYGFAFNYLPYEMSIYFLLTLIFLVIRKNEFKISQVSLMFVISLLFVSFRNILDSYSPQNIFYCLAIIGVFSLIIEENYLKSQNNFCLAFIIAALGLSLLYLVNYDKFIVDYDASQSIERSGWIDPNYFSGVLGMGVIASLMFLIKYPKYGYFIKIIAMIVVLVLLLVQIMLASRGGLLAISVSLSILLMFSKIKLKYKILTIGIIVISIVWMYYAGLFQLLEYRIQNDAGGGSGRFDIWVAKLNTFINDGNIIHWLFGYGYKTGFELTNISGGGVGFHNDFIAILCEYGILGLIIFLYWLLYPLSVASNENKLVVLAILTYLFIICLTLEPISSGALPYFAFYFLSILVSKSNSLKIQNR